MHPVFPFDLAAQDAISRAESDPEQAAEALRLVAACLRRGEALPANLAEYLAGAIEASMGKPQARRAAALCNELHLTAQNRRPAAYWPEVGAYMTDLIEAGASQNAAAVNFRIGEPTAVRYLRQYREAMRAAEAVERLEAGRTD
ncbi:hypothetical protein [Geopseudomonas guangdongensis]|uniref:Uncharacterized protein n=1 Tax=Geopseudomonas guangdongensis TaxID=1245526 RepID=A0A1H2I5I9_9GAMM|nr:hypothetical protein [Pseudomonas guangdongensis]SDU39205.1 hypothetical protein SAMN05216580_2725 [Pseudomonas guangdongensis]